MKIYKGFSDAALQAVRRAAAIGIFDGVHLGHQRILKKTLELARRHRARSCVVTFEPHPARVLFPEKNEPAVLMSLAHRLHQFKNMGIQETVVVPFDRKFSKTSRESFVKNLLLNRLGMICLCVGSNFRFGYHALGDLPYLADEAKKKRFSLAVVKPVFFKGRAISSTRIRRLIETGKLKEAARMLGRPVSVAGTVIRGRGRGKTVGFPTANLNPHHEALPPPGVYAACGYLEGKKLKGVIHIGKRPTFGDEEKSLEVHFFDFHRNIYGKVVELNFAARLRPIRKFRNAEALNRAIRQDSIRARQYL